MPDVNKRSNKTYSGQKRDLVELLQTMLEILKINCLGTN